MLNEFTYNSHTTNTHAQRRKIVCVCICTSILLWMGLSHERTRSSFFPSIYSKHNHCIPYCTILQKVNPYLTPILFRNNPYPNEQMRRYIHTHIIHIHNYTWFRWIKHNRNGMEAKGEGNKAMQTLDNR